MVANLHNSRKTPETFLVLRNIVVSVIFVCIFCMVFYAAFNNNLVVSRRCYGKLQVVLVSLSWHQCICRDAIPHNPWASRTNATTYTIFGLICRGSNPGLPLLTRLLLPIARRDDSPNFRVLHIAILFRNALEENNNWTSRVKRSDTFTRLINIWVIFCNVWIFCLRCKSLVLKLN